METKFIHINDRYININYIAYAASVEVLEDNKKVTYYVYKLNDGVTLSTKDSAQYNAFKTIAWI